MTCSVPFCSNKCDEDYGTNFLFYKFPTEISFRQKWIDSIRKHTGLINWLPHNETASVCSWHFPIGRRFGPSRFKHKDSNIVSQNNESIKKTSFQNTIFCNRLESENASLVSAIPDNLNEKSMDAISVDSNEDVKDFDFVALPIIGEPKKHLEKDTVSKPAESSAKSLIKSCGLYQTKKRLYPIFIKPVQLQDPPLEPQNTNNSGENCDSVDEQIPSPNLEILKAQSHISWLRAVCSKSLDSLKTEVKRIDSCMLLGVLNGILKELIEECHREGRNDFLAGQFLNLKNRLQIPQNPQSRVPPPGPAPTSQPSNSAERMDPPSSTPSLPIPSPEQTAETVPKISDAQTSAPQNDYILINAHVSNPTCKTQSAPMLRVRRPNSTRKLPEASSTDPPNHLKRKIGPPDLDIDSPAKRPRPSADVPTSKSGPSHLSSQTCPTMNNTADKNTSCDVSSSSVCVDLTSDVPTTSQSLLVSPNKEISMNIEIIPPKGSIHEKPNHGEVPHLLESSSKPALNSSVDPNKSLPKTPIKLIPVVIRTGGETQYGSISSSSTQEQASIEPLCIDIISEVVSKESFQNEGNVPVNTSTDLITSSSNQLDLESYSPPIISQTNATKTPVSTTSINRAPIPSRLSSDLSVNPECRVTTSEMNPIKIFSFSEKSTDPFITESLIMPISKISRATPSSGDLNSPPKLCKLLYKGKAPISAATSKEALPVASANKVPLSTKSIPLVSTSKTVCTDSNIPSKQSNKKVANVVLKTTPSNLSEASFRLVEPSSKKNTHRKSFPICIQFTPEDEHPASFIQRKIPLSPGVDFPNRSTSIPPETVSTVEYPGVSQDSRDTLESNINDTSERSSAPPASVYPTSINVVLHQPLDEATAVISRKIGFSSTKKHPLWLKRIQNSVTNEIMVTDPS